MYTYAIGDIQGCYTELQRLLEVIHFNPNQDTLWCTGDLVNRGPNSLEVLRFFKQLGNRAIVVLGNHDLHLLAVAQGHTDHLHAKDTIMSVLQAPDCVELINWLRHRPFLHHDADLGFTLVHAGLPPQWDLLQARQCACEVEEALRGPKHQKYLANLYGDAPDKWTNNLTGWHRLRFITNCFTRLRYCHAKSGKLALKKKGSPNMDKNPNSEGHLPWFLVPNRASQNSRIIFGHWSTLGYHAGNGVYALDTGCLWGGTLTALRLEDQLVFEVPCAGECMPEEMSD
jgi:bis(5'-nucleosyl)-tetraphosphatase (symmetrical)